MAAGPGDGRAAAEAQGQALASFSSSSREHLLRPSSRLQEGDGWTSR